MYRLRSGFTLLELVLVMAIVLVAGALTIPAINSMLADSRVKAARDQVRSMWAEGRARAIDEGRAYKFSVINGTGMYRLEPFDGTEPSDTGDQPLIVEDSLPPQVLFAQDPASGGSGGGAGGDYQTLAVFLPNGRARDDVQILFGNAGGSQSIGLRIRGLTGAVTSFDQFTDNGQ